MVLCCLNLIFFFLKCISESFDKLLFTNRNLEITIFLNFGTTSNLLFESVRFPDCKWFVDKLLSKIKFPFMSLVHIHLQGIWYMESQRYCFIWLITRLAGTSCLSDDVTMMMHVPVMSISHLPARLSIKDSMSLADLWCPHLFPRVETTIILARMLLLAATVSVARQRYIKRPQNHLLQMSCMRVVAYLHDLNLCSSNRARRMATSFTW